MKKEHALQLLMAAFKTIYPVKDFLAEKKRRIRQNEELLTNFPDSDSNTYFKKMVEVVFYSGFKAEIVTARIDKILQYLGDYKQIAGWGEDDIARFLDSGDIIKNMTKIRACIYNAKKFIRIDSELGSFGKYLLSFNNRFPSDTKKLPELLADIQKKFKFLKRRTSRHFLMICGFPLVKPDVMVMRVLFRLGLIPGEEDEFIDAAERVCLELAENAKVPMSFVDELLVGIGQSEGAQLCRKIKPLCGKCELRPYCRYNKMKGRIRIANLERD